jgi:hypothetical protein
MTRSLPQPDLEKIRAAKEREKSLDDHLARHFDDLLLLGIIEDDEGGQSPQIILYDPQKGKRKNLTPEYLHGTITGFTTISHSIFFSANALWNNEDQYYVRLLDGSTRTYSTMAGGPGTVTGLASLDDRLVYGVNNPDQTSSIALLPIRGEAEKHDTNYPVVSSVSVMNSKVLFTAHNPIESVVKQFLVPENRFIYIMESNKEIRSAIMFENQMYFVRYCPAVQEVFRVDVNSTIHHELSGEGDLFLNLSSKGDWLVITDSIGYRAQPTSGYLDGKEWVNRDRLTAVLPVSYDAFGGLL